MQHAISLRAWAGMTARIRFVRLFYLRQYAMLNARPANLNESIALTAGLLNNVLPASCAPRNVHHCTTRTRTVRHATDNVQQTTCSVQQAPCYIQLATDDAHWTARERQTTLQGATDRTPVQPAIYGLSLRGGQVFINKGTVATPGDESTYEFTQVVTRGSPKPARQWRRTCTQKRNAPPSAGASRCADPKRPEPSMPRNAGRFLSQRLPWG
jgi:hypothetical protein